MSGLWTNDRDTLADGLWMTLGSIRDPGPRPPVFDQAAYDLIKCRAVRVLDPDDDELVERLCEVMHNAYEDAAKSTGWETQQASRKPWADVPEANKATMRVAVRAVIEALRQP